MTTPTTPAAGERILIDGLEAHIVEGYLPSKGKPVWAIFDRPHGCDGRYLNAHGEWCEHGRQFQSTTKAEAADFAKRHSDEVRAAAKAAGNVTAFHAMQAREIVEATHQHALPALAIVTMPPDPAVPVQLTGYGVHPESGDLLHCQIECNGKRYIVALGSVWRVSEDPAPPAPAPATPFLSVCSRHQKPDPSCPAASPAPAGCKRCGGTGLIQGDPMFDGPTPFVCPEPGCSARVPTPAAASAKSRFTEWLLGYEGRQRLTVKDAEAVADKAAELFGPVTPAAAPLAEGRKELPDAPGFWERDEAIRAGSVVLTYVYLDYGARLSYLRTINGQFVSCGWIDTLPRNDWHPAAQHPAGGAEREELERLRSFKATTHAMLDALNVPTFADTKDCRVKVRLVWLRARLAAAEQRASQLGNQLESVCGALVDAGTVPAAREDGDYGASVRMLVAERDHALKAHLAQVAAGAVVLKELAAAQERVGVLTKALEEIASNTIHFTEIDVVDEDWRKRRAYRALATIAPPAAAAEVAGQEERA